MEKEQTKEVVCECNSEQRRPGKTTTDKIGELVECCLTCYLPLAPKEKETPPKEHD